MPENDTKQPAVEPVAEERRFVIELPKRGVTRGGRLQLAKEFLGAESVPSAYDEKQEPADLYTRRRLEALGAAPVSSRGERLKKGAGR